MKVALVYRRTCRGPDQYGLCRRAHLVGLSKGQTGDGKVEVLPGIHLVSGIPWSRVYLIEDKKLAMVDSGPPWGARKVVSYIRSIGRNPEDLEFILMTHSHPDHASGALPLIKRTGARLLAHPGDTQTLPTKEVCLSYLGLLGGLKVALPFLRGAPVTQTLEEGLFLPILEGVRVLHTPGHTPGSVCYLLESRGVMFSGDTVFSNGQTLSRSVPFPRSNRSDYRQSLRRLATLEFDALCGGHGKPLLTGASDKLRALLAAQPEPPTWGGLIKGIPRRLYQAGGLSGEHY